MAELDTHNLLDSQFAWIEPGGMRDTSGKTTPRDKRHFPIHTLEAVRRSLSQAPSDPFGKQAMPAIVNAARKFGVRPTAAQRAFGGLEPDQGAFPELRFTRFPPELREEGKSGAQHIWGYAACFDKLSRRLGGFVEQVNRNAFDESKQEGWPDVVCRYNHKDDALLGTTYARTLTLGVDETGLAYDVLPPDSRKDVLEYVQRGDIRHSSFAFRVFPGGDEWGVSDQFGYPMRTLHAVQLIDVAPVLDPAYPDATAAARAIDGAVRSLASWAQAEPEEVRDRLVENRAMDFFKRTDNIGPRQGKKVKQERKKTLTGALAMLDLLDNSADPYVDAE